MFHAEYPSQLQIARRPKWQQVPMYFLGISSSMRLASHRSHHTVILTLDRVLTHRMPAIKPAQGGLPLGEVHAARSF
jgi:hypothetical protein